MTSNERLKELRAEFGLTQSDFGKKIGLKQAQIRDIESGKQKVSIEISQDIEKIFNINASWLIFNKGEKYINRDIAPSESTNDKEFLLYYDIFKSDIKTSTILNKPKKIYNGNPLLSLILKDKELISFPNNLIIVKDFKKVFLAFNLIDSKSAINHYLDIAKNKNTMFKAIFKNNLFEDDYPLLEDNYLGEICYVTIENEKFLFQKYNQINDNITLIDSLFLYLSREKIEELSKFKNEASRKVELTPDEFSKLTIIAIEK